MPATDSPHQVRPVAASDFDQWAVLFRGYRDFYRLAPDEQVISRGLVLAARGRPPDTGPGRGCR